MMNYCGLHSISTQLTEIKVQVGVGACSQGSMQGFGLRQ